MEVRPAIASDSAAIARVHVASWQGAYRGILPDEFLAGLSVERRTRAWENILLQPENEAFVAFDDAGDVVGFASLAGSRDKDASPDAGEVTTIYVTPEKWGGGYGRALMLEVLARAVVRGFGCLTLWVLEENGRARRFYEAAGFVPDGATKTDTLPGEMVVHEVRYRLDIRV